MAACESVLSLSVVSPVIDIRTGRTDSGQPGVVCWMSGGGKSSALPSLAIPSASAQLKSVSPSGQREEPQSSQISDPTKQ